MMSDKTKGYALGAIAAATYGMNPLFALPLYEEGMNPDSVLFYRYLFAIPMLAIMIKSRGRSFKVSRKELAALIVMGLLMAFSSLALFMSYNYMDAGIASTMLFVYPVMVAVIMAAVFKERLPVITIVSIMITMCGLGLLYQGNGNSTLNPVGVGIVMLSALSYAIYIVAVNRSVLKDTATVKLTFYVLVFGFMLFFVKCRFGTALTPVHEWYHWGNLITLALLPTVISFLCTTQAVHYIGSTPTAILGALEPVTAIFFGVTLFDEKLTVRSVTGIILIILAVTMIVAAGNITSYLIRLKKLFPKVIKKHTKP